MLLCSVRLVLSRVECISGCAALAVQHLMAHWFPGMPMQSYTNFWWTDRQLIAFTTIRPTDPMRQTMASLQMLFHWVFARVLSVTRYLQWIRDWEFGSQSVTLNVKPQLKAITISGYQTIESQTRSRILHSFHFSLLCVYICYSLLQMFCSQVIAVCLTSRLADHH